MDDLNARVVSVHASEPQVEHRSVGFDTNVLQQVGDLLELVSEGVPIKWVAGVTSGTHHQPRLMCNCDAHLVAELVRFGALTLTDTRNFWRMQCKHFVPAFITALLKPHACYQVQQRL